MAPGIGGPARRAFNSIRHFRHRSPNGEDCMALFASVFIKGHSEYPMLLVVRRGLNSATITDLCVRYIDDGFLASDSGILVQYPCPTSIHKAPTCINAYPSPLSGRSGSGFISARHRGRGTGLIRTQEPVPECVEGSPRKQSESNTHEDQRSTQPLVIKVLT